MYNETEQKYSMVLPVGFPTGLDLSKLTSVGSASLKRKVHSRAARFARRSLVMCCCHCSVARKSVRFILSEVSLGPGSARCL